MTKHIALSGVALAVLALAATPTAAQLSINGNDSGGISVDIGNNDGGDDGGLLNLGDDGDGITGNVSVGDETIVDLDAGSGNPVGLGNDEDGLGGIEVDLFGPRSGGETQLAVDTGDDNDDDVLLTLFGTGGGADTASIDVLPGSDDGDPDADIDIDLFGGGNEDGTDPTQTGSTDDDANGGDGAGGGSGQPLPDTLVAAAGDTGVATDCFTPDEQQIAHLLARGSYEASVTAQWNAASDVNLVAVNLCPQAQAEIAAAIAADPDAAHMQRAVATNAMIVAELRPSYSANDVLAVDQSGNELTVYVY